MLVVILLSLGAWQVYRLQWKTALLVTMDARLAAAPVALPATLDDPSAWEYRRVTARGRYGKAHFLLKPRTENGRAGFHVLAPLVSGGRTVFVNRGFADDKSYENMRWPKGIVTVEGMAVIPKKGFFTPANNPEKNDWYWADIEAMAAKAGTKNASPVIVSSMDVKPAIANNHLQYAIFWFGMAAMALLFYILWRRKNRYGNL